MIRPVWVAIRPAEGSYFGSVPVTEFGKVYHRPGSLRAPGSSRCGIDEGSPDIRFVWLVVSPRLAAKIARPCQVCWPKVRPPRLGGSSNGAR